MKDYPIDDNFPQKCEKCGGCNFTKGQVYGAGTGFLPKDKSVFNTVISIYATACKDCGHLFDFELSKINRHKLK